MIFINDIYGLKEVFMASKMAISGLVDVENKNKTGPGCFGDMEVDIKKFECYVKNFFQKIEVTKKRENDVTDSDVMETD